MLGKVTVADFFSLLHDTATTVIYTLSLHDALPISQAFEDSNGNPNPCFCGACVINTSLNCRTIIDSVTWRDRKSTRLNSSHSQISYAVFCLKKKSSATCEDKSTQIYTRLDKNNWRN